MTGAWCWRLLAASPGAVPLRRVAALGALTILLMLGVLVARLMAEFS